MDVAEGARDDGPSARDLEVVVVGNGERPPELVKDIARDAHIIGVDGGAQWVLRWGLVPTRILGDLDSLDDRTRSYADEYGTPIIKIEHEPMRSDLSVVVDVLRKEMPSKVVFTGCAGPRADHTMAAFFAMARLAMEGVHVEQVERWGTAHLATPRHPVSLADLSGESVSLFPLTPHVEGLELKGFDDDGHAPGELEPPFDGLTGLRIVSDPADVRVKFGVALVYVPRQEAPDAPQRGAMGGTPTFRLGSFERTE